MMVLWPLRRTIPLPATRTLDVPRDWGAAKYVLLECFSHDPRAAVELLDLRVGAFSGAHSIQQVTSPDAQLVQFRTPYVPSLPENLTFPRGNLLSGEFHPYDTDAWIPMGNRAWRDKQNPGDGSKPIRCVPFSKKRREVSAGESEGVYGGFQFLRFDGAKYGDFRATLHITLADPTNPANTYDPFVSKSHAGAIGLAFSLQDSPPPGCSWGGGSIACFALDPKTETAPLAEVVRWSGFQLSGGTYDFGSVRGVTAQYAEVRVRKELNRADFFAPHGFTIEIESVGPVTRMSLNGVEVLEVEDPSGPSPPGRIALHTARLIATIDSLEIIPR
ncbi:MAG: hypothetical protein IID37_15030 [Planctomycetes bacterium]|nr:hypothetical protein [Planctomycetota bacterium]